MRYLTLGLLCIWLFAACSSEEEGLIGEWKGTTESVNNKGKLVEVSVSCKIKSTSGNNRSISLEVGRAEYIFTAIEDIDELIYKDRPIQNDTSVMSYISGSAVLLNDTLLRFDHKIYVKKNGALLYSDEEAYDMTRK